MKPQKANFSLNIKGRLYHLDQPKIMAILNITPDSFYDGNKFNNIDAYKSRIDQIIEEGADIIDLGGQSTRPGANHIEADQELERIIPPLNYITQNYPNILVSIDTFHSSVVQNAVKEGAHIVNDISCGRLDPNMHAIVSRLKVPYIAMHSRGTPQNMQSLTEYSDVTNDVIKYFSEKIFQMEEFGIHDIIIDPGFGFAKNFEQNYELMQNISYLQVLKKPILVGISRKSMINRALNIPPNEALNGTTVLNTFAILKGAHILRVHDVKEAVQAVKLLKLLTQSPN